MSNGKIRVAVFFGGRSPEHDVSIVTGLQVIQALDASLYEPVPVYVDRCGVWRTGEKLLDRATYIPACDADGLPAVSLEIAPGKGGMLVEQTSKLFGKPRRIPFDVAIPAFHGPYGEDGDMQGLFEAVGIPYTGMRVLASAIFMDKAATKQALSGAGIPMLPCAVLRKPVGGLLPPRAEIEAALAGITLPGCLKPAHLGSSIGVAKVDSIEEIEAVLPGLFRNDTVAIVEPYLDGCVEYNISVRRDGEGHATSAIERPKRDSELLDFRQKYLSAGGKGGGKTGGMGGGAKSAGDSGSAGMLSLTREINPDLPESLEGRIRDFAVRTYAAFGGTGAPRMDFMYDAARDEVWLNEVNPIPGSFAFFLWEAAETPVRFTRLLSLMIDEARAMARHTACPEDPTPEAARLFPRR